MTIGLGMDKGCVDNEKGKARCLKAQSLLTESRTNSVVTSDDNSEICMTGSILWRKELLDGERLYSELLLLSNNTKRGRKVE